MMLSVIQADLKSAMKSGDREKTIALRNVITKLKSRQIDKGESLIDDETLKIIQSYSKQLKDSIAQYKSAGREDLMEKETYELTIIENYLPKALSSEEIRKVVQDVIDSTDAVSMSDIGKVMPLVMKEIAGRGDGKTAQNIVREMLS